VIDAYYRVVPHPQHQMRLETEIRPAGPFVQRLKNKVDLWSQDRDKKALAMPKLSEALENLQKQCAGTTASLISTVLKFYWHKDNSPVVSKGRKEAKTALPQSQALAEEFVSLVYVNFLVTVLLRMRTLVLTAGGIYVLLVLSISVYPFEPNPALQTLAVALILLMGAVVGYVYAEMHRDVILSRLTSTTPGELGKDFWIKFASAAAIPVLSLLAAQFPSITQFLFSWLEPALEALK